ncbi:hypothetical protein [Pseudomonas typographi]|uniref:hypothetical protein n=1 Tax=Pseudomonas typographi TaxID=2715964 RepID=UPI0016856A4B|nr:hypothetical protein [Pseudomonas typographi]MBD1590165.1 hypothetical protein [Pseudomonas typographi]
MSTSDLDILYFSESILSSSASEVVLRAAISRGYYGAFHHAKSFARRHELPAAPTRYRGSHEKIIYRFLDFSDHTILPMLKKQKMLRVKADYELEQSFSFEESRLHVASCRKLAAALALIEMLGPDHRGR